MQFLGVENLIAQVIETLDTVNHIAALLFRYIYAIGCIILQYLQILFLFGGICWERFIQAWGIIWTDFLIFLSDIVERSTFVQATCKNAFQNIYEGFCSSGQYIIAILLDIGQVFMSTSIVTWAHLHEMTRVLFSTPERIKQGIIKCGNFVWVSLQLIPMGIMEVYNVLMIGLGRCYEELSFQTHNILQEVIRITHKAIHFWCDVPLESTIGLVIAASAIILAIKYRYILICTVFDTIIWLLQSTKLCVIYIGQTTKHVVKTIFQMMAWLLYNIWKGMENAILKLVTNQLQTLPPPGPFPADDHVVEPEEFVDEPDMHELRRLLHEEQETKLCIVCQDKGRCVIILPCRHLCLCSDCCDAIKRRQGTCPICRHRITRKMQVYL